MACYQENSIKPYNLEVILTSKAIKVALSVHEQQCMYRHPVSIYLMEILPFCVLKYCCLIVPAIVSTPFFPNVKHRPGKEYMWSVHSPRLFFLVRSLRTSTGDSHLDQVSFDIPSAQGRGHFPSPTAKNPDAHPVSTLETSYKMAATDGTSQISMISQNTLEYMRFTHYNIYYIITSIYHLPQRYECWAYVCRTLKHLIWLSRVTLEKRVNYL